LLDYIQNERLNILKEKFGEKVIEDSVREAIDEMISKKMKLIGGK